MADMTFKEFCRQRRRMCDCYDLCESCPLYEFDDCDTCGSLESIEEIVKKWAQEHPEEATNSSDNKTSENLPPKTYEQGLDDAWELGRKIVFGTADGGIKNSEVFNCNTSYGVYEKYSVTEAMQKLQEWEDKNSFKVGDIVEFNDGIRAIVMDSESEETVIVFNENFCVESDIFKTAIRKTGRNIADKLNALLEEIGGKNDDIA